MTKESEMLAFFFLFAGTDRYFLAGYQTSFEPKAQRGREIEDFIPVSFRSSKKDGAVEELQGE